MAAERRRGPEWPADEQQQQQQQQEAKHGSSPLDLTAIWLREDEEERRDLQEEEADLPTLFDQLEQSLSAACGPSPTSPPTRRRRSTTPGSALEPHDSDDDMQQEEARLPDSAQKLKRVLDESTPHFFDASLEEGSESEESSSPPGAQEEDGDMGDALDREEMPVRRALLFSAPETSPPPSSSIPTQPEQHEPPPPSLASSTSPPPPQQPASVTLSSYWDCPQQGEADNLEEEEASFATPLGGAAAGSVLRRSSSAFSLGVRSLTGSPPPLLRLIPQHTTDANDDDDEDGKRDMHEVVCASEQLSEAAILLRFTGLRAIGFAGPPQQGGETTGPLVCRHLAIFTLRPDVAASAITALLVSAAQAQGLVIAKRRQGAASGHVVAAMPSTAPDRWWEWRCVDMQLAVDRQSRDRVLLVRFLLLAEDAAAPSEGGGAVGAEARRRRPATRAFLETLQGRLVEARVNKHALARLPGCKGLELDGQYLCQLEDLSREDMNRALEAQARVLEDYARAAEQRCARLKGLLSPTFELYKVAPPALGKPLPLSYYPLDLLSAYDDGGAGGNSPPGRRRQGGGRAMGAGCVEEEEAAGGEEGTHGACPGGGCLACMETLQAHAWAGLLRQCDAEMTARLQRKNRQVVDRLGRASDYERLLLCTLKDTGQRLLSASSVVPTAFRTFQTVSLQQLGDGEVDAPLYHCPCIVGARPATLHITHAHLVFISRLPGFSWHRRVSLKEVRGVAIAPSSFSMGFGRLAQTVEVEVCSPSNGKRGNESVAFSSTAEPERLVELIKLLVSIQAEEDGEAEEEEEEDDDTEIS